MKRRRRPYSAGLLLGWVAFLCILFLVTLVSVAPPARAQTASGELQEIEDGFIEITVNQQGEYSVNDRVLVNNELNTLIRALTELLQEGSNTTRLIVTADARATHQTVVRAMDAAGKVGLTRISITTRQPDDEG